MLTSRLGIQINTSTFRCVHVPSAQDFDVYQTSDPWVYGGGVVFPPPDVPSNRVLVRQPQGHCRRNLKGCVFGTHTPSLIMKLTDRSEYAIVVDVRHLHHTT